MFNKFSINKIELTLQEKTEILDVISNYKDQDVKSCVIEVLKIFQKHRGWISRDSIFKIANILNISECDVEEVATFYSQIFRQPVGRNIIKYCDSMVCYVNGYEKIKNCLEKELNIIVGQTTTDFRFTLLPICCLGNCDKSPTMMINDDLYSNLTEFSVIKLLELYR